MALMWALAIAGVVIAFIRLLNPKREVGADLLVYLAALLSGSPLIRTLLPGNPGLGVLADFAVYFWVEEVVGVTWCSCCSSGSNATGGRTSTGRKRVAEDLI